MATVDPIYFINNRCRPDVSTTIFTASSTAAGYAIDNARSVDLALAWKPSNGTSNEWLMADGGSTGWLGAANATFGCCVAYDARNADQVTMILYYDTADDPAFTSPSSLATFTLYKGRVACEERILSLPTTAKRYWRLVQLNTQRGGGTKTAIIYNFALHPLTGMVRVGGAEYAYDTPGQSDVDEVYRVAVAKTAGGVVLSNAYAKPGQQVTVRYQPSTDAMQEALRDLLHDMAGNGSAIYAKLDGIANPAEADFFMVQLIGSWRSGRRFVGQREVQMTLETVPWR